MGACASMPKAMRGVNGGAPPPEPPKEETSAAATVVPPEDDTANATGKEETAVGGGEKKDEGGNANDGAKPEDENDKDGSRRSLGTLLESEEVKEVPTTDEKIIPETQTIPEEQKKSDQELPVSDKAAGGEPAAEKGVTVTPYVAPVARATEEDKETENN